MHLRVGLTLPSLNETHLMSVSTRGMKLSENLITGSVTTSKSEIYILTLWANPLLQRREVITIYIVSKLKIHKCAFCKKYRVP